MNCQNLAGSLSCLYRSMQLLFLGDDSETKDINLIENHFIDVFVTSEYILMYIIIVCCCNPIGDVCYGLPLYGMSKLCLDLEVQPTL